MTCTDVSAPCTRLHLAEEDRKCGCVLEWGQDGGRVAAEPLGRGGVGGRMMVKGMRSFCLQLFLKCRRLLVHVCRRDGNRIVVVETLKITSAQLLQILYKLFWNADGCLFMCVGETVT